MAQGETGLLEEINQALEELDEDGTYAEIYEKWFKIEPPEAIFGGHARSEMTATSGTSHEVDEGAPATAPLRVDR